MFPELFERVYLDDLCGQIQPMYMTIDKRWRKVSPKFPRRNQRKDIIHLIALRSNYQVIVSQRKVYL
jgi:hypothetical protein